MKRRRIVSLAVVGALGLWIAAATVPAQTKDKATLRLNFYTYGEHAAFAYGVEKGIYAEEGIDLTLLEGGGSGPVVQSIGAATDRFGYADATTMAKLVSKGLPVKMIANYVQTSPMSQVMFASHWQPSLPGGQIGSHTPPTQSRPMLQVMFG